MAAALKAAWLISGDKDLLDVRNYGDVKIIAHFNPTPVLKELLGGERVEGVRIDRGAFIGIGAIILPGVHIGEGSLIGPGSVVTKDVDAYRMVAGNPARPIKSLKELKDSPE